MDTDKKLIYFLTLRIKICQKNTNQSLQKFLLPLKIQVFFVFPPEKTPELIPSKDPREPTSPIENPIPVPEENPFLFPPEISN